MAKSNKLPSHKKGKRSARDKAAGVYVAQRCRTRLNKISRLEKQISYLQERLTYWRMS